jgi:S-adenosyl-L-methionine hydrolase (adenosine-forming)
MTGLRGEGLPETARLGASGRIITHAPTFSAASPGAAFWYVNANGLVEIAVNLGRADRMLGLAVGSAIAILA